MKNRLLVIGAGGHGKSVAESVLLAAKFNLVGFADDACPTGTLIFDVPVLGKIDAVLHSQELFDFVVVALGNNVLRKSNFEKVKQLGGQLAAIIHNSAYLSPSASIGEGVVIMAGSIVGTEAVLADGVVVNSGAVVDHHCSVGAFGHLGVGAVMAGGTSLGSGWNSAAFAGGRATTCATGGSSCGASN